MRRNSRSWLAALGARGAVGRQMRLPGLDMVFRLAAPAVDILVKYTGVADPQVGDDEACVGPFRAGLHTATIRSTRLQLAAPSKNSLKRPVLPSFGAAS